jgi:hypothetical protein
MKQTNLWVILLALIMSNTAIAQVYNTAQFNTTTPRCEYAIGSGIIAPIANDYTQRTIELWYKIDTLDNDPLRSHYLIYNGSFTASKTMLALRLNDSTLTATWADKSISTHVPFDTMWHHIAFIVQPHIYNTTTLSYYDSTTLYLDGTYMISSILPFDYSFGINTTDNMSVGFTYDGPPYKFIGNIAKITMYDTVLYTTSFTPDCVYDTTYFYDTTVTYPCVMLLPLNGNTNVYYANTTSISPLIMPFVYTLAYSYNVSPCAPTYTFYRPMTAPDTFVAEQHNPSYMKGAHMPHSTNGWDMSTLSAPVLYGLFTDKIHIDTATIGTTTYTYISEYYAAPVYDTTITIIDIPNSINMLPTQQSINIYPNPSHDGHITIKTNAPAYMTAYDMTGRMILNTYISNTTSITLPHGLNIIHIGSTSYKIVVE